LIARYDVEANTEHFYSNLQTEEISDLFKAQVEIMCYFLFHNMKSFSCKYVRTSTSLQFNCSVFFSGLSADKLKSLTI